MNDRGATEESVQLGGAAGYNFAYLDERTKRMIRRALLKAVALPGHQVPFGSREMPLPYGWGTGGIQVTAAIIGRDDILKVIDQGSDDTTNAVNIRQFFARTAGVATTDRTADATLISPAPSWSGRLYRPLTEVAPYEAQPVRLTAIPYHLWANRDPSPMRVWLRRG